MNQPHVAILIEEGRKDNTFTLRLADRVRARGGRVTIVFTRGVASDGLAKYVNGHELFLPPTWRNEFAMRYGLRELMLGGWVSELHARGVNLLFAVLDFSQNSYLLSEMLRRYQTPAGVISRCLIPKRGTWEVEHGGVVRLSWPRRLNSALRQFMVRREARDKQLTRSRNTYFAWGEYDRERLLESGVPSEHILISGCPLYEGMLEGADIERVQRRRVQTDAVAGASRTAIVYSQPLERPFMLGSECGMEAKRVFLRGLARAGFQRLIVHLHPEESELSPEFRRDIGVSIDIHRNMDLAKRLDLLQEHGWYFTIASTSIFEGLYAGARAYLYQAPGLGPVDLKLPGFPVLTLESLPSLCGNAYAVDREKLVARWLADADHSITFLENWICDQLRLSDAPQRQVSDPPLVFAPR